MEHSSSKVRCSAAAFLLAAGITVAACGDDSGGTTPTPPQDSGLDGGGGPTNDGGGSKDGGAIDGGSMDGGVLPIADATTPVDAAAELAAAINPLGINVSMARVDLLIPATCDQAAKCGSLEVGVTASTCAAGVREQYYQAAAQYHLPDTCLDAALDLFGCLAVASCDNDCTDLLDAKSAACDPYLPQDDGGI